MTLEYQEDHLTSRTRYLHSLNTGESTHTIPPHLVPLYPHSAMNELGTNSPHHTPPEEIPCSSSIPVVSCSQQTLSLIHSTK